MKPSVALQAHRARIHDILARHRARNPRVFHDRFGAINADTSVTIAS